MNADLSALRWFFQRLTGLFLTVLLAIHIITLHFTVSEAINFQIVVTRIQSSVFWLIFYVSFLFLTLWHGFNGVYEVVCDYAPSAGFRRFMIWFFWLFGLLLFAWGMNVLLTWKAW
jgi:succinate dehydrogenase hydrophobic anchor subunit